VVVEELPELWLGRASNHFCSLGIAFRAVTVLRSPRMVRPVCEAGVPFQGASSRVAPLA
jgi:hypothetical protein